MYFKRILGLVNDPQFAIDAVDLAICYEEEYLAHDEELLSVAMEDLFLFHADLLQEIFP